MKGLKEFYHLKDGYEKPTRYLGAEVIQWRFLDELQTKWALSSAQYIKEAIQNVELELTKHNL